MRKSCWKTVLPGDRNIHRNNGKVQILKWQNKTNGGIGIFSWALEVEIWKIWWKGQYSMKAFQIRCRKNNLTTTLKTNKTRKKRFLNRFVTRWSDNEMNIFETTIRYRICRSFEHYKNNQYRSESPQTPKTIKSPREGKPHPASQRYSRL